MRPAALRGARVPRPPGHPYNTIRPILHEPGPIGDRGICRSAGIPVVKGEVLGAGRVHDTHSLHVAAMGFWVAAMVAPDDSVQRCGPLPGDIVELNRPKRFDRTPAYDLAGQLAKPGGAFGPFDGRRSRSDNLFAPQKMHARRWARP